MFKVGDRVQLSDARKARGGGTYANCQGVVTKVDGRYVYVKWTTVRPSRDDVGGYFPKDLTLIKD